MDPDLPPWIKVVQLICGVVHAVRRSEMRISMNKWLNKLERKYGSHAIPNLMYYIIIIYAAGAVIGLVAPSVYYNYLALDIGKVLHGQVWRLFTFLLEPYPLNSFLDYFWLMIELYLYYYIGRSLEQIWGSFRFNLYYLSGVLCNIIAAFILYAVMGDMIYPCGLTYISRSLFLAFAVVFPDVRLLLMFIIPIKVKWLGYLYGGILAYDVILYMLSGTKQGIAMGVAILVAVANFLVFFFSTRNYNRISPQQVRRKQQYRKQTSNVTTFPRHRCTVCGRTERDNPDLEFRFCSKCQGEHEYCMEHLYTHEHIVTYINSGEL